MRCGNLNVQDKYPIVAFGLLVLLSSCSSSPEKVVQFVLAQDAPISDRHYVVFKSYGDSVTGHIDVVWGRASPGLQSSLETGCFGFYSKQTWLQFTFASMPGHLVPCSHGYRETTYRVIFVVSAEVYERSQAILRKWRHDKTKTEYQLLYRDCVTFAEDIAGILGLNLPERKFFPPRNWLPASFLESLISANQKVLKKQ